MNCRLCLKKGEPQKSHIIPEFLYKELYNDKNHMMGITGLGNKGWKPLQKGLRELLLCRACEGFLNDKYEKPFLHDWIRACPLPKNLKTNRVYPISIPSYTSFKLFHLSVLFRAGVSTLAEFGSVNLGPHEEIIRKLLLSITPGKSWQYLIIGYPLVNEKSGSLFNMISQPLERKFNKEHRCYSMIYGGVEWWITISSHRTKDIEEISLQENGSMQLRAIPWQQVPNARMMSNALNNPRT